MILWEIVRVYIHLIPQMPSVVWISAFHLLSFCGGSSKDSAGVDRFKRRINERKAMRRDFVN